MNKVILGLIGFSVSSLFLLNMPYPLYARNISITNTNWNAAEKWTNQGLLFGKLGNYPKAIDSFTTAINNDPKNTKAYYNRGIAWFKKQNFAKAIEDFSKAIELKPDYAKAYCNRGITRIRVGNFEKAISDFNAAIEHQAMYSEAYFQKGMALKNLGKPQEASEQFEMARKYDQQHESAKHRYTAFRGPQRAKQAIQTAKTRQNDISHLLSQSDIAKYTSNLSLNKVHIDDIDKTISDYNQIIAKNPQNTQLFLYRGIAWDKMEEYDSAILDFNKALELDSDNADTFHCLGVAWHKKGDFKLSLSFLNNAIKKNPDNETYQSIVSKIENRLHS